MRGGEAAAVLQHRSPGLFFLFFVSSHFLYCYAFFHFSSFFFSDQHCGELKLLISSKIEVGRVCRKVLEKYPSFFFSFLALTLPLVLHPQPNHLAAESSLFRVLLKHSLGNRGASLFFFFLSFQLCHLRHPHHHHRQLARLQPRRPTRTLRRHLNPPQGPPRSRRRERQSRPRRRGAS